MLIPACIVPIFPLALTMLRLVLVFPIAYATICGMWGWAFIFFLCAAISDMLDGACARMLKQVTVFGGKLDACADNILMVVTYGTLLYSSAASVVLPAWLFALIIIKQGCILFGMSVLRTYGYNNFIKPTFIGRVAMGAQEAFIGMLFLEFFCGVHFYYLIYAPYCIAVLICAALAYHAWHIYGMIIEHA